MPAAHSILRQLANDDPADAVAGELCCFGAAAADTPKIRQPATSHRHEIARRMPTHKRSMMTSICQLSRVRSSVLAYLGHITVEGAFPQWHLIIARASVYGDDSTPAPGMSRRLSPQQGDIHADIADQCPPVDTEADKLQTKMFGHDISISACAMLNVNHGASHHHGIFANTIADRLLVDYA